jgi:hypothetical protein
MTLAYPEQFMAQQMPPTLDDYIDRASLSSDARWRAWSSRPQHTTSRSSAAPGLR